MGAPWTVKKYMDDVFCRSHGTPMPAMAARVPMPLKSTVVPRSGAGEKSAVTDVERADGSILP